MDRSRIGRKREWRLAGFEEDRRVSEGVADMDIALCCI